MRVTCVKNLKAIDELYFFIFLLIYYVLENLFLFSVQGRYLEKIKIQYLRIR